MKKGDPINKITPKSVQKALRSWHSTPKLGKHPLAQLNIVEAQRRAANYPDTLEDRGRALREVLRDAINKFPHHHDSSDDETTITYPDKEWRPYVILTERFIQGRNQDYVAAQLGIARRTYFEEQANAIKLLADILCQREESLLAAPPSTTLNRSTLTLDEAIEQFEAIPLDSLPEPGPLPPGSLMPLSRNPMFVGRERDLKTLAHALKGGETVAIGQIETAAATGLGGIGKTQLASEFVHRYAQFFRGGVFWLSFADPKAVPAEVAACGGMGALELRPNFGELSLEDQIRLVKAAWQEPIPRLLVFDNCEKPELLAQWRPASGGCRILVTSRRATWEPVLGVQPLPLDVLSRAESLSLLREYCPKADIEVLEDIAEELGDLPLALHLAGSYIATYKQVITPAHYLAQLQSPALLEHLSFEDIGPSPTRHVQNIYRTMTLSYDRLDPDNPIDQVARQILACAVCLAPGEPIPHDLLMDTLHLPAGDLEAAIQAENALKRLLELGLIIPASEGAVRLHRLVVAFIQDTIAEYVAAAQEAVESALEQRAAAINQSGDPRPLLAWQPHLRAVTDLALVRKDLQAASLCNELGWHLWHIGDYADGRPYFERALEIRRGYLGKEHPDTAHSYNSVGYLLRSQGKLSEAKPYLEQALAIREKVLGKEHPVTAESLNDLGRWHRLQGNLDIAQSYFERALTINVEALGENHPFTAEYANNLGGCLYSKRDYAKARPYLERALAINTKIFGREHLDTTLNLNNLGLVMLALNKYDEAEEYLESALIITKKILGKDHVESAHSLHNLGLVFRDRGDLDKARYYFEQSLKTFEALAGEEHIPMAICLNSLGTLLQKQGELDAAHLHLEQALTIRQKAFREDHPLTALSHHNLGLLLQELGDLDGARQHLEQAVALRQKVLGEDHPDTVLTLNKLALLLQAQDDVSRVQV